MSTFKGYNGQSLFDVCLNTYGSLDYLYKLLQDSGVNNINAPVKSQDAFTWDNQLVQDQNIFRSTTAVNVIFATAASNNQSVYYIVEGKTGLPPSTPYTPPYTPPSGGGQYQKTSAINHTIATEGNVVTISGLIGKDILQIERNIQPTTDYTYNKTTGTITFVDTLMIGENLYILCTEMINI